MNIFKPSLIVANVGTHTLGTFKKNHLGGQIAPSGLIYSFLECAVAIRAVALRRISKMTPHIRYGVRRIVAFTI